MRVMRRESISHERVPLRDNKEVVLRIRGKLGVDHRREIARQPGEIVPVQMKTYFFSPLFYLLPIFFMVLKIDGYPSINEPPPITFFRLLVPGQETVIPEP